MKIDEAIKRIKEHMVIHKMNEPQAIFISKALCMGIDALEKSKWKSVEDELPKDDKEVLIKLVHTYADDGYYQYSIGRYIKLEGWKHEYYWHDYKYGYLEHERYSEGYGGISYYKVSEWKEI